MGAYEAMNHIAAMATGDFVAIYHSDDVYEPTIVEREVAHLVAHPEVAAVFCKHNFMDEVGRIFGGVSLPRQFAHRTSLDFDEVMRYTVRRKNALFACPTFMMRREVFEASAGFVRSAMASRPTSRCGCASHAAIRSRFSTTGCSGTVADRTSGRRGTWTRASRPTTTSSSMDEYIAADDWGKRLTAGDRAEHEFHRGDDATYRAANLVRRGDPDARARAACAHIRSRGGRLLAGHPRRKLRNLVLRTMILAGVALGAMRPLSLVLERIGP